MNKNKKRLNIKRSREYVLLFVLVLLVVANVFYTIGGASNGAELNMVEGKIRELSFNNQSYQDKIMDSSSLQSVSVKAEELGFIKPSDIVYIAGESAVAKLP